MYGVEEEAVFDLLEVYSKHLDNIDVLREVYNHYEPVVSFLTPQAAKALESLYPIAYPESDSKVDKPNEEEIDRLKDALREEAKRIVRGSK